VSFEFFINHELINSPLKSRCLQRKAAVLKSFKAEILVSFNFSQ